MSKKTLDFSGDRVMEVKRHDGRSITIRPRRVPLSEIPKRKKVFSQLREDLESNKISESDYMLKTLEMAIVDFKIEDFSDMESEELSQILEGIGDLRRRTEEEKKTL